VRILGIDYGDKSIGLAVSDLLGITAQPLGQYQKKNKREDKKYFQDLINTYEIKKIVIGLPLRMDGSPGTRVQKTKEFSSWLEKSLGLPVTFWDERLTTKEAHRILGEQQVKGKQKKKFKDQVSATIILSAYLESKR
jgi:putative Holliday junction resolvase